jgi:glycosyltransferase involved in cell wall biosynthesis
MSRGLPVVGYAAAAVPSTIGDAGVIIGEKDPLLVASVVHELLADDDARAQFAERGYVRAEELSLDNARAAFRAAVSRIIARG